MEEQEIQLLINRCVDYLTAQKYTQSRIKEYRRLWSSGVVKFMNDMSTTIYTPKIGEEYENRLVEMEVSKPVLKERSLSVRILNDMLLTGKIRKREWHYVHYEISGALTNEINAYLNDLKVKRRSEKTIGDYRRILSGFQTHLHNAGITHVNDINERIILSFIEAYPSNKAQAFHGIHALFRYWMSENLVDAKWNYFFSHNMIKPKARVCSFYSIEEMQAMEGSMNRNCAVGKRNYAMMLLASRLGLRVGDIAALKFSDIDWDNNSITIITQKTGRKVELPLLAEIGNAIIDYLKYGRKESDEEIIFLSAFPPYGPMKASTISSRLCAAIKKSGVDVSTRHHGAHCLRHSLATAMLSDGSTIPVISETLGHKNSQTTMTYIKVDLDSLRRCSLPVPPVSDEFYNQEGGYFYE